MGSHVFALRKEIARELCEKWDWRDGRGRRKDFAARSFLLKLHESGAIQLPPLRSRRQSAWAWRRSEPAPPAATAAREATLADLQPLSIELVEPSTVSHRHWRYYLAQHHYLGLRIVGENLGYLVRDRDGRDVACLLFGAPAWRCAARDRHLGWSSTERVERLSHMANNTRFLILPWVRVPHLASHVLGLIARRIDGDWQRKYAHGLWWLETFVERDRFAGTCHRAANWRCVGSTQGRSRQDRFNRTRVPVKDVYLYRVGGGHR